MEAEEMEGWKSMANLKKSHFTSLDIRFLRGLIGDKAGRTGWSNV